MKKTIAVPFKAKINPKTGLSPALVAEQIEAVIQERALDGWEFVSVESVSTTVEGNGGCFGIGATPSTTTFVQVILFQR